MRSRRALPRPLLATFGLCALLLAAGCGSPQPSDSQQGHNTGDTADVATPSKATVTFGVDGPTETSITVLVGGTLDIVNEDTKDIAVHCDGLFDAESTAPGSTRSVLLSNVSGDFSCSNDNYDEGQPCCFNLTTTYE